MRALADPVARAVESLPDRAYAPAAPMEANVEIKARARNLRAQRAAAEALATAGPEELVQVDTFFACPHGRLKLREFGDGRAELIQYQRPDGVDPRMSRYERVAVSDAAAMHRALATALGVTAVVRKRRTVLWAGRTRIHLDRVEGLGAFIELEVVLAEGEDRAAGVAEARRLAAALGIAPADFEARAYADLLMPRASPRAPPGGGASPTAS